MKLTASAFILVSVVVIAPIIGLSGTDTDAKQGVMIDFGYYDVIWIEFSFADDMTGTEALEEACARKGYEIGRDSNGTVSSIAGKQNLIGVEWGMYILGNQSPSWTKVDEPDNFVVGNQRLVSWARASDISMIMPGTDATGFTYYDYSSKGKTAAGEELRIATMAPSATETLVAVGGLDMIKATDMYSNYPSDIAEGRGSGSIVTAGGYSDPNFEILISMMPDIVFLDGSMGEHLIIADKLRKSGVNCVVLREVTEVSDLLKNIWIAASAIGFSEKGNDYIRKITATVDSIRNIAEVDSDKVFLALSPEGSTYTPGTGTYADSMIRSLGATNVFSDSGSSWFMVSKAQVYAKQPDVIVILDSGRNLRFDDASSPAKYKELVDGLDSQWKFTPAAENKKIIVFSGSAADLLSRPGPRLSVAMELLAKSVDSESFEERDYWDRVPNYFGSDYIRFLKYQSEGMLV